MPSTLIARQYDADGKILRVAHVSEPAYLDWMPIEVKAFWFCFMGEGDPKTETVLIESQGEQLLIKNVTLESPTLDTHKEKVNDAAEAVEGYVEEHGICRTPRNQ